MGIDLFTFTAQVINLIILLFLLRKFLYIPVLKAVDERQKLISAELNSAKNARRRAELSAREYENKMQELETQKQTILLQAKEQAEKLSKQLQSDAKKQYQKSQKQWKERLLSEQDNFETALQKTVAEHFNRFAQKALQEMAGAEVNNLMLQQLKEKIKRTTLRERADFANAFSGKKIVIESAKTLSTESKKDLETFLHQQWNLPENLKFSYVTNPELISGLALQAQEQRIEWSLSGYLQDFRKNMNDEILQLLTKGER